MKLPNPKSAYPEEVYEAIICEHQHSAVQLARVLMACGWTMAEAAWAAVHWDLWTLAAAVADERAARNSKPTNLSENDLAKLRTEMASPKRSDGATTRSMSPYT